MKTFRNLKQKFTSSYIILTANAMNKNQAMHLICFFLLLTFNTSSNYWRKTNTKDLSYIVIDSVYIDGLPPEINYLS